MTYEQLQSESLRKIADVIQPFALFMTTKGVTYLKDVKTEHLAEFRQTWKGRRVRDPKTKIEIQLPKSQHGRAKYQEYLKGFFKRSRLLGWISANPAELLEPIRTEDPEIKIYTAHEKKRLLEVIPLAFPKKAAIVRAFVLVQRFSALRISDTVSLEIQSLNDEGITIKAQRKTDTPVYCALTDVRIHNRPDGERWQFDLLNETKRHEIRGFEEQNLDELLALLNSPT